MMATSRKPWGSSDRLITVARILVAAIVFSATVAGAQDFSTPESAFNDSEHLGSSLAVASEVLSTLEFDCPSEVMRVPFRDRTRRGVLGAQKSLRRGKGRSAALRLAKLLRSTLSDPLDNRRTAAAVFKGLSRAMRTDGASQTFPPVYDDLGAGISALRNFITSSDQITGETKASYLVLVDAAAATIAAGDNLGTRGWLARLAGSAARSSLKRKGAILSTSAAVEIVRLVLGIHQSPLDRNRILSGYASAVAAADVDGALAYIQTLGRSSKRTILEGLTDDRRQSVARAPSELTGEILAELSGWDWRWYSLATTTPAPLRVTFNLDCDGAWRMVDGY